MVEPAAHVGQASAEAGAGLKICVRIDPVSCTLIENITRLIPDEHK
jgi:hypothetical protein